ncbi:MAG: TlpA disulfide reductase family protein [Salinivirgaceae bacterium]|nr:TlpA disulfide reductase family protein [Salinivirgaceae bacterium]
MMAILNHLSLKKLILTYSILLSLAAFVQAQDTVIVEGAHETWANTETHIWYYDDYISGQRHTIGKLVLSDSGSFHVAFPLDKTRQLFVESGALEGTLFAVPGQHYKLKLPKYQAIAREDELNPFFQPLRFYFGLENSYSTELNHLISEFDYIYQDYIVNNFSQIQRQRRNSGVDEMIHFLDSLFQKGDSIPFFRGYKKYKTADLRKLAYIHDNNYVIRDYFLDQPILYNNPAYCELFNKIFANYLETYMNTQDGRNIGYDVARAKSYGRAMSTLNNNLALRNDTLRELVLIKGLNDAIYKNTFPKSSVFQTLDSVQLQTTVPEHKKIVANVISRAKMLRKGFPPPPFVINMGDTLTFQVPSEKKKYLYITFIDIESFAVQKVLPDLKMLAEKHKKNLEIVSINMGSSYEKASQYFDAQGYNWTLLDGNIVGGLRQAYNVKAFPMFYLIDPEGNLAMHPTPSPDNHFEWYFFNLIKQRERQMYRQAR